MNSPRALLPARWSQRLANVELVAGTLLCSALGLAVILKGVLQTHDPVRGDIDERFARLGTNGHWFGTDNLGRDLWSRMLEGLGWSVSAALTATVLALSIGLVAGTDRRRAPWLDTHSGQSPGQHRAESAGSGDCHDRSRHHRPRLLAAHYHAGDTHLAGVSPGWSTARAASSWPWITCWHRGWWAARPGGFC